MVTVDYFSSYVAIDLHETNAYSTKVPECLKEVFPDMEFLQPSPQTIAYSSIEMYWKVLFKKWGIDSWISTPHCPLSNTLLEKASHKNSKTINTLHF